VDRRTFLRSAAGLSVASSVWPGSRLFGRESQIPACFGLHPFIEAHPEAVFVRPTHVASRDDSAAKRREAFELAKRIFTLRETPGIDLSQKIAIKPNLTATKRTGLTYAIVTDPYVVEGLIDGLRQAEVRPESIYVREGLMPEQPGTGYRALAQRQSVHYGDDDSRAPTTKECPDGVVFRRTKYLGPYTYSDAHVINVAKLKTHAMGLTLCVKNLQGTNVPPYIRFCGGLREDIAQDFQPDAEEHVDELLARHQQAGIPRWRTMKAGWMEMWAQRTVDAYSLIRPSILLNVIEGIYAQNGDGFDGGPGPSGLPEIFPTNVLLFGKDAFRVDIIGHWLAGQEPGNFGLFHIGRERGVSTALNPRNIPIYRWQDDGPKLAPLEEWARTPLATPYLQKEGEPRFHLCNEPYTYPAETPSACLSGGAESGVRVLGRTGPGKRPSLLAIEFNLPADADASLEMLDAYGARIDVLARGRTKRGVHMVDWAAARRAPGVYRCRLTAKGIIRTAHIALDV
jgi:uncharacterized protein (DUF362 family)